MLRFFAHTAAEVVDRVIVGSTQWGELFDKHDFFHKYKYYLQVIASSGSADMQLKWSGTVESRVRQLIMKLELVPTLICAHPFIKGFNQVSHCLDENEVRLVAIGDIPEAVANRTKLKELPKEGDAAKEQDEAAKKEDQKDGSRTVWTTTFYIGLCVEPRQGECCGIFFPRLAGQLTTRGGATVRQPTPLVRASLIFRILPTNLRPKSRRGSSLTTARWGSSCGISNGQLRSHVRGQCE